MERLKMHLFLLDTDLAHACIDNYMYRRLLSVLT
jgi:hypothetical protein